MELEHQNAITSKQSNHQEYYHSQSQSGATRIQQILKHTILNILKLDTPGTKHSKASLHEKHKTTSPQ